MRSHVLVSRTMIFYSLWNFMVQRSAARFLTLTENLQVCKWGAYIWQHMKCRSSS